MNPCGCGHHGMGVAPGPCISRDCVKKENNVRLKSEVVPTSAGTDAKGEPFEPKLGAFTNTVVRYEANGAIYIYDSRGIYTCVRPGTADATERTVEELARDIAELLAPTEVADEVGSYADLTELKPQDYPNGSLILVRNDETHGGQSSLYFWNASINAWDYSRPASPYYTMDEIDAIIEAVLNHINEADNELQEKINAEEQARTAADAAISERIEGIVNSPDVRYIVDNYAGLQEIEKSTIGDQDYARVLQDETHENASTYYQFSTATQEWSYVGQTGPYYTKGEIDDMIGQAITRLEAI